MISPFVFVAGVATFVCTLQSAAAVDFQDNRHLRSAKPNQEAETLTSTSHSFSAAADGGDIAPTISRDLQSQPFYLSSVGKMKTLMEGSVTIHGER